MNDCKVNILGTEYEIHIVDDFPAYLQEAGENAVGLCGKIDNDIFIKRCKDKDITDEGRKISEKETLRHEIIHAYLLESGLPSNALPCYTSWTENEEMIDWFAIQSPKIFKTFQEAGCI